MKEALLARPAGRWAKKYLDGELLALREGVLRKDNPVVLSIEGQRGYVSERAAPGFTQHLRTESSHEIRPRQCPRHLRRCQGSGRDRQNACQP